MMLNGVLLVCRLLLPRLLLLLPRLRPRPPRWAVLPLVPLMVELENVAAERVMVGALLAVLAVVDMLLLLTYVVDVVRHMKGAALLVAVVDTLLQLAVVVDVV